jgi:enoyl-CoA hydratase/carnithine racemase
VTDELQLRLEDGVLTVEFNRPEARNAMTFAMYEGLHAACERADADDDVKVLVLTGAGPAFVAGADIAQFASFTTGQDGLDYELGSAASSTGSRTFTCRPWPSCAAPAWQGR